MDDVAGEADPFHDAAGSASVVRALDATALVLEDADQLEVPNDTRATLAGMARVVDAVLAFMS